MPFTITEPHPTVQANAYTHSGRGGLGNTFRAPTTVTPAAGIPTPLTKVSSGSSATHTSTRFYAGRGGAGNAYPASKRPATSLDDEYIYASAAAAKAQSTGGYVGRGGAGNFYSSKSSSSSHHKKASGSTSSGPLLSTADRIAHSIRLGTHGHGHGNGASSAGNFVRKGSDASSVSGASTTSSEEGRRSGFWGRMHR
ncbi:uncharacterized protein SPSK_09876 [Sporothrix schenckii 1099-18]|uniref:Uncharacterized protein n=2 Tax=Sporothrix schenckii TaxID=29908 RepID=U7Q5C2_SPOS1|nr:uncharacterized protein SPSK_09876 [Sporothrix schenckii 1099-18]ERT03033.1 hypothetical protein HMPREF1624_01337 [Sporothrix schenckii ATCC 58251]KJR84574.1 hypothetical protein SPSK_09876 [Sporothrix schenckii 1099-18]